ncbi:putative aldouronate transport system permease protein [Fontibacillus phaseoli]|uniref:Putative aldouronate transport system permease protein n=1 Tax=Fontibacillus phaseoli TaxID=1416533 RepID=A0A369AVY4_9BACL|nr:carbohydrate ABC transporter permease [Fontibacillus phaseoli]RCX13560.1 putative aldouronate transport system permease protein [Fontibacillus phaseoli]
MPIKHSGLDRFLLALNAILLTLALLLVVLPLLYVVVASFMDPSVLLSRGLSFRISDWTLGGYQKILSNPAMVRGFGNAVLYSVSFALITVTVSVFAGYALSDARLKGRGLFMTLFLITLFFGGGLVPTYLLVKNLGLIDTIWAVILPGAVNVWNIILSRTFFKGVPHELKEAANVDGASEMKTFFQIVLPLSKPIIFVLALYAFVGQWNSYFDAMIYLDNPNLHPLQLVLRSILIQNQVDPGMISDQLAMAEMKRLSEIIKYAAIVISSLPLVVMYPFFQKYFEKGVMVGSLK